MPFTARVRNFQSIEDATIYVDGLTVITGCNNSGKTALLRALRGVFMNTRGHGFVRKGSPQCTINVDFPDASVQWEKGTHANNYKVSTLQLTKVGAGVPPEVQALGVHSVKVGDEQIWPQIAPQLSGVQFLLDKSPTVLAEALADVERVNRINRALRDCESERKQVRSDFRAHEEMLRPLTAQKQHFETLDFELAKLREIEAEHVELVRLQGQIQELESLNQRLQVTRRVVRALDGLERLQVPLETEVTQLRRIQQALGILSDLASRLARAREAVRRHGRGHTLESIQEALHESSAPLQKLEQGTAAVRQVELHRTRLKQLRDELAAYDVQVEQSRHAVAHAQLAVKTALGTFAECPTCGEKFQ